MNEQGIKPVKNKGINNPKNRQLFVDILLVVLSFTIPHANAPLSAIAIIRIALDFHQSRKEDSTKEDK